MKIIDIETWKRKEHFEFFSKMQSPYFGIVTEVDCTETHQFAKDKNESFFAHYLHKSMIAVNKIEEFKYRIINDEVVVFDVLHAGSTIGRKDGTFGFSFMEFSEDFEIFNKNLQKEIDEVQHDKHLQERDMFFEVEHSDYGKITGINQPFKFSETPAKPSWAPPLMGEDNDLLNEL